MSVLSAYGCLRLLAVDLRSTGKFIASAGPKLDLSARAVTPIELAASNLPSLLPGGFRLRLIVVIYAVAGGFMCAIVQTSAAAEAIKD